MATSAPSTKKRKTSEEKTEEVGGADDHESGGIGLVYKNVGLVYKNVSSTGMDVKYFTLTRLGGIPGWERLVGIWREASDKGELPRVVEMLDNSETGMSFDGVEVERREIEGLSENYKPPESGECTEEEFFFPAFPHKTVVLMDVLSLYE